MLLCYYQRKVTYVYIRILILYTYQYTSYQIIGNLLLTFPLGILMAFVVDCRNGVRIGCSVLFSVSIELIQLIMIISLHLIDICFDVNDILLNVVGCLCGNAIFYIFCKIYVHMQDNETSNSFTRYLNQVCNNCVYGRSSLYGTTLTN